jgi:protein O-GlcNAc transferase
VDVARFARELPALFEDFPASEHPRDRHLAPVLEAVPGLARENNLALLNLAVSCLDAGESYAEAGSFRGTSLIGAALGNQADLVAIDDFSKADADQSELRENLARFGVLGVTILEGDVFELLRGDSLAGKRIGVWYYDAGHAYEQQLDGLRLVEPYLADRALLIVDDSDWEQVGAATRDYLAGQPKARLLFDVPGKEKGLPWWWEGMHVIAWKASRGKPARS